MQLSDVTWRDLEKLREILPSLGILYLGTDENDEIHLFGEEDVKDYAEIHGR
jgi:hypothetical protein